MTDACHASGVLASLSVMNKDMDQCGPEGTTGHLNFQKALTWTTKAGQQKKLQWNRKAGPIVN